MLGVEWLQLRDVRGKNRSRVSKGVFSPVSTRRAASTHSDYRDSFLHSGFIFPAFLDRRIRGCGYRVALAGGVACRTRDHVLSNGVRALGKEESGSYPDGTACVSKT